MLYEGWTTRADPDDGSDVSDLGRPVARSQKWLNKRIAFSHCIRIRQISKSYLEASLAVSRRSLS